MKTCIGMMTLRFGLVLNYNLTKIKYKGVQFYSLPIKKEIY